MEHAHDGSRDRDEARAGLRHELSEVVGDRAAERAERDGTLDKAIDAKAPKTVLGVLSESRVLLAITLFVALIVGAVIALITGSWIFLLVALVLHAIGTAIVVATGLSLASQTESVGAGPGAALEARGVSNPDAALNQAVDAVGRDSDNAEASEVRREQTEATPSRRSDATDRETLS